MIEVYNNFCKVRKSDTELFDILRQYLLAIDDSDRDEVVTRELYFIDSEGDMIIPKGLDKFIPDIVPRNHYEVTEIPRDFNLDYDELAHSFGEIVLREDQIAGIKKMLVLRRGIVQAATGSGKTEIISGFLKALNKICGYIPDTIILEPTLLLVNSTVDRLNKYGIPAVAYSESRGDISGVVVTHPMSLNNDLEKDPDLLKNLKVFLSDEGHHLQAETWNRLLKSTSSVEFSIALSASVIDPSRVPIVNMNRLSYSELLVVGATGDIIFDVPPSYYIDKGILARPILFRILNAADEYIAKNDKNWHEIRKNRLESEHRTELISMISSFLASQEYKSLVLVGTKDHAYRILEMIDNYGFGDVCRCSFGGGAFYKWDRESSSAIKCKDEDTMKDFDTGKFKIFIGTSHIYEGADIKNLDCVILASIGKNLRKVIQGVGRAIRKTKKSKKGYAYLIDFTDHYDRVLSKHSRDRVEMYTSVIGVRPNDIYEGVTFQKFKNLFASLEEIS